ncbi:sensory histidine kinase AtoS [Prosthecochloris sp. CIB 2401]|nr:sensory histidine kinase AtoS [Prosthecochloris sp. CIB 2401]
MLSMQDQHMYYRSEHSAVHIPGTGLGLAIVKDIADFHGGQVEVSSRLNLGSAFSVVLP